MTGMIRQRSACPLEHTCPWELELADVGLFLITRRNNTQTSRKWNGLDKRLLSLVWLSMWRCSPPAWWNAHAHRWADMETISANRVTSWGEREEEEEEREDFCSCWRDSISSSTVAIRLWWVPVLSYPIFGELVYILGSICWIKCHPVCSAAAASRLPRAGES